MASLFVRFATVPGPAKHFLHQIVEPIDPADNPAQITAHGRSMVLDPCGEAPRVNRFWRQRFHRYKGKRRHRRLYCGFNVLTRYFELGRPAAQDLRASHREGAVDEISVSNKPGRYH